MSKPTLLKILVPLILAAGTFCLTGCYERVVSAKGLGAERIETQERYQQDTKVDRWFYGNEQKPR
jgi:hypothetical protein